MLYQYIGYMVGLNTDAKGQARIPGRLHLFGSRFNCCTLDHDDVCRKNTRDLQPKRFFPILWEIHQHKSVSHAVSLRHAFLNELLQKVGGYVKLIFKIRFDLLQRRRTPR